MRLVACLLLLASVSACSTAGERYARATSVACGSGDRDACEALATIHPQALMDADAIMAGMQRARSEYSVVQRAAP